MKKLHKTIDIYNSKNYVSIINNIYYFLYSKIVWENEICKSLNKHGYITYPGSDKMDIAKIDLLIQSNVNKAYYGTDVKIVVWSKQPNVRKQCIAISEFTQKYINNDICKNKYIIFWYNDGIYLTLISNMANINSTYVNRGNMMYEYIIDDLLPISNKIISLSYTEVNIYKDYKKSLDKTCEQKIPMPSNMPEDEKLKLCNDTVHKLGLDEYFYVHFNFIEN